MSLDVFLSALLLPMLMVIVLTKVTYSRIMAVVLTVILIMTSAFLGYTNSLAIIIVDAFSITVGLIIVNYFKKKNEEGKEQ
ncbi:MULTISPECIES: DUF2198 family protein [Brochothrix]|uniref:DUF2198 domain-containing protein n=3 Tax=Brochothrix thermosphacta TaxID=2756 RepID=A0A1D2KDP4_BROTH|nr:MULTISPECIES: DUF2198 family protein [Brochothrix]ANZ96773.1 hypothetical protein BFC20_03010 [Brochothrix thermosphacta]ATF26185.1 DUF2198 domain-containing protein [Brochothrix thermosphacta]ATH85524.1 DUF2198 domain-containing protein [Brochothrix thermosphacta]EUJ38132.1 hypothetical protein BTHER_02105 [Brochothrix thermosphacta DSM 20171 = FSL F6-1036]MBR5525884.1 DUF2198 family protein [Brochothrix sp.]